MNFIRALVARFGSPLSLAITMIAMFVIILGAAGILSKTGEAEAVANDIVSQETGVPVDQLEAKEGIVRNKK